MSNTVWKQKSVCASFICGMLGWKQSGTLDLEAFARVQAGALVGAKTAETHAGAIAECNRMKYCTNWPVFDVLKQRELGLCAQALLQLSGAVEFGVACCIIAMDQVTLAEASLGVSSPCIAF